MIKTDAHRIFVNVDRQHPYPGLHSFRETESEYFHGRTKETRDLAKLIEDNVLTVVFGKSGVGKTSLLRAGLMPKLRDSYFLPIYLRVSFGDSKKPPSVYQVKDTILKNVLKLDPDSKPFYDLTLWEYFSTVKILNGFVKPLLFFDQFEEMFTTGKNDPEDVNEFVTELADLIENRVPVSVQEKLKKEKKTITRTDRGSDFRVIFSLREDYLPQLEMLYNYIPSIRFSRYRVSQMKGKNAIDAVLKPGKEIISDPEVAVEIIKKIPGAKGADYRPYEERDQSWKNKKIEPFLLSLFCFQMNEKRLEKKADEISRDLIKDVHTEDIIKDYYEKNINRFKPNVKIAIEDLLLTAEGYRKMQDLNSLESGYNVTAKDIEGLIDRRIIRKETRTDIEYVELIHDVLTPILKESRDKRKEEENRKKELAAKKKKYSRIIVGIIGLAAIFLAILTLYAFKQKKIAEDEGMIIKAYELAARSTNLLEKDPTLSFRLAERAYHLTEKANPDAYKALLSAYYSGEFYSAVYKHESDVFSAGFSSDGNSIITVDRDEIVRGWDLHGKSIKPSNTGKVFQTPEPKTVSPTGMTFNIPADADQTIQVLDAGGNVIRELKGHTASVNTAGFSPDGKCIVTAGGDNTARLWNVSPGDVRSKESFQHTSERADFFAAFSPDGNRVLTVSSDKAVLWDLSGSRVKEAAPKDDLRLRQNATFSPDGKYIVFLTNSDEEIGIWNLDGEKIVSLKLTGGVNSAAFSPDGQKIITASRDNNARLWDLKGKELKVFKGHEEEVNSAVFSPDGEYVVTACWDKTARLWNSDGSEKKKLEGHESGVNSAVFSTDGEYIVTASNDGTARLWELSGAQIAVFEGHTAALIFAVFSSDGKYVVTGGDDRTTRLWDLNCALVYKFQGFDDVINGASFSPDGKYILIAPARGPAQLRLVDAEEIIRMVNSKHVWQFDEETKKKYNL